MSSNFTTGVEIHLVLPGRAGVTQAHPLPHAGLVLAIDLPAIRPGRTTYFAIFWTIHGRRHGPCAQKYSCRPNAVELHQFILTQGNTSEPVILSLTICPIIEHFSFHASLRIESVRHRSSMMRSNNDVQHAYRKYVTTIPANSRRTP